MSGRPTAHELLELVLDHGTFTSWDEPTDLSGLPDGYRAELTAATERSGVDESILTGSGSVQGRPVAVIVNDFRFLAGSIGRASAARIVTAVRRATAEGLPLLAATASGGTRMQEGTPAFVRMVDIARAIMEHRAAGLPYLVYLRHPTTGGVFASWGSLGHVTIAEPKALVGFLGPKVYEMLNGRPFPADVQTAENLAHKGVIDAVVSVAELPQLVENALQVLVDPPSAPQLAPRDPATAPRVSRWESIVRTRHSGRPGIRDVLRYAADVVMPLSGTERGERDATMVTALARLDGQPCVVVGQDGSAQRRRTMGPGALREARRGMLLAEELRIPLVSFIDTPGAELSAGAEERAVAGEIARCIALMSSLTVPTLSVLLGQGCGGGALALLAADTTISLEHAWLSPLPPEGASAILFDDVDHAEQMAEQQKVGAFDLLESGVVSAVIAERDDDTPLSLSLAVVASVAAHLSASRRAEKG